MHDATFPKWIVICSGGFAGLIGFAAMMVLHQRQLTEKAQLTQIDVGWVATSCSNYFAYRGAWPTSLQEIATEYGAPTHDAWGHNIGFVPFTPATGCGRVISYGRDGNPGGKGPDADVEVRFGK